MFGFLSTNFVAVMNYRSLLQYPCPKNMKFFWNFGILSLIFLLVQLLSGIFLTLYYEPCTLLAFDSVEHIIRNVNYGWIIRSMHSNGASFFFFFVYLHILRGIYYRTYRFPRTSIWIIGVLIYILLMASAFLGYVLPWGQMSYWAATVITNLVTVLPYIGDDLVQWLWGGYSISNATLHRIYTFHFILPFVLTACVVVHIYILHQPGSSSELGVSPVFSRFINKVTGFHAYYITKDLLVCTFVLTIFGVFVFYLPEFFNHPDNYNKANSLVTPTHIVPEWYFLPFYGMLRSILEKKYGIIIATFAIISFFFIAAFEKYGSITKYNSPDIRFVNWTAFINFICLGILGSLPPIYPVVEIGLFCTYLHIAIFYIIYPSIVLSLQYIHREWEAVPAGYPMIPVLEEDIKARVIYRSFSYFVERHEIS